jgi:hypothetical protein
MHCRAAKSVESVDLTAWNFFTSRLLVVTYVLGSVVYRGSMLQVGRSRVLFPIRSLNFFNLHNPSSRTKADNLTAICEPIF